MARKPPAGRRGSWEWSRTAQTRQTMLRAAREVFTEHGFAEASISQVIERAGSSVGSLYHHFGGKTELFIAVWESFQDAQEEAAAASVAEARAAGVTDPLELFAVGSRTFLENAWRQRDLVRLFLHGDTPPGFELTRRARARGWVRQNAALLGAGDDPLSRLTVTVMSGLIGEAMWEVATSDDETEARQVTEAALTIVRRFDFLADG
ncbi:TetR/AcrR family transcriptional regulator [Streptomyces sp. URMC 129]|uniref:TetR/AcrR family transcriptional regulator n=1 Tax=Streptomyces sp. URMC 129 TaxID=3423407 RepID=UPI003F1AA6D8